MPLGISHAKFEPTRMISGGVFEISVQKKNSEKISSKVKIGENWPKSLKFDRKMAKKPSKIIFSQKNFASPSIPLEYMFM